MHNEGRLPPPFTVAVPSELRAAHVVVYTLREPLPGENLIYDATEAIPTVWSLGENVWPCPGEHTEEVLVQDFHLMLWRNINSRACYCFCVPCQVQRILDMENPAIEGEANPVRTLAIPSRILQLYMTYFNTNARRDGAYHEAAVLFESCHLNFDHMVSRPVRSTICAHLSSFAALQIVVQFDDRIEAIR
jgi:hypothetical protein